MGYIFNPFAIKGTQNLTGTNKLGIGTKTYDVRKRPKKERANAPHSMFITKLYGMKHLMVWAALLFLVSYTATAQPQQFVDEKRFEGLQWRNIGPYRGGRCVTVAGIPNQPLVYYMGTTGGGVWKTEDAGISWKNISDGFFNTSSIGAIAIAPSDPNVLYVGTGEHPVRGVMTSAGDGVYKSVDGGRSWEHIGLKNTRHISAIQIHPKSPNVLFVAAQGALHGSSEERGVYRSTNGGKSWQKVLYINETTGPSSLSIDPSNPRILYAGMWDHQRQPWEIRSGGPGSGLYRSTDGGINWEKCSDGLPSEMGKVGVAVSPADPQRIYAIIEADKGGVYRSDNRGDTWELINDQRVTIARAWYYTKIVAAPHDPETVYVLNAPLLKSTNGGQSFSPVDNPHSDQHALWINPDQPSVMILGNDGGATVSLNGGKSWSSQRNQPTAQLYRVIADNRFPYYLYAGQQDNSTLAIPSRTASAGISSRDWYAVAGGESAFIALDPDNPRLVYGGSYQGNLSVFDQETQTEQDIMAYPALGLGKLPSEMKYRFNWNAPLVVQPQNPSILYHGANKVLKSEDGGSTWSPISPDLTRDVPEQQGLGGGPFTNEGAGGENYNTISYLACSPHEAGTIWVGTDDGRVHLTKDEGANWEEVTPAGMGEALVNSIEVSPHDPATAYLAVNKYKFNNFEPIAYITKDYGKSWTKIIRGIGPQDFLRTIREDPEREGLLFAGTEHGLYISFNGGLRWQRFQLNLPNCPITDLLVKEGDLVAATAGRSFWILDDITPLRQTSDKILQRAYLYDPSPAVRFLADSDKKIYGLGQNPPNGAVCYYYLPEVLDSFQLTLDISDAFGNTIRSFSNHPPEEAAETYEGGPEAEPTLPSKRGLNRFVWDLRREPLPGIPEVFILGGYQGSLVPPGEYQLQLTTPYGVMSTNLEVLPDPRLEASEEDYSAQQEVLLNIEDAVREIHLSVKSMRQVKQQVKHLHSNLKQADCTKELIEASEAIVKNIDAWEEKIIQPKQETYQDVINYPNQLSAELMNLKQRVDSPVPAVTAGAKQRLQDLLSDWATYKSQMREILEQEVGAFNKLYRSYEMPVIVIPMGAEQ
jgi:photosystem II stability/assembly factor-like uncharacterized protein